MVCEIRTREAFLAGERSKQALMKVYLRMAENASAVLVSPGVMPEQASECLGNISVSICKLLWIYLMHEQNA